MNDETTPPPVRKGRGCFFYGCLTSLVLVLIAGLMAFFTVRYIRNQITQITESAPMNLPAAEMAEAEFSQLKAQVKSFNDALEQGQATEPLVLTERNVNALLANGSDTKELADKVYFSLAGEQVKGQVSIPLSFLGWFGKGRYLNGEATFKVSLENGVLIVTAQEVQVKGKPLPDSIMVPLRQENLAKEIYKNPKNAETIRKLESLLLQDGQVIIKARVPTP